MEKVRAYVGKLSGGQDRGWRSRALSSAILNAGVPGASLQRFLQREQSLSVRELALLCSSLELRLVARRRA
jgi:hypothetical protein